MLSLDMLCASAYVVTIVTQYMKHSKQMAVTSGNTQKLCLSIVTQMRLFDVAGSYAVYFHDVIHLPRKQDTYLVCSFSNNQMLKHSV